MAINLRRVGEVADGSITAAKLADLAVTTEKLAANAVTAAKSAAALKRHVYVGDEEPVSVTGTVETEVKNFALVKSDAVINWSSLHIQAEMKTSNAGYAATLKLYVDDEASARITLNTTSATYEIQSGSADISDLATGKHTIHIKLVSADAGATAYNDMLDVFTEV